MKNEDVKECGSFKAMYVWRHQIEVVYYIATHNLCINLTNVNRNVLHHLSELIAKNSSLKPSVSKARTSLFEA